MSECYFTVERAQHIIDSPASQFIYPMHLAACREIIRLNEENNQLKQTLNYIGGEYYMTDDILNVVRDVYKKHILDAPPPAERLDKYKNPIIHVPDEEE